MKIRNLTIALAVIGTGFGLAACGTETAAPITAAPAAVTEEVTPAVETPAPVPASVDPAALRAQLVSAGDDWIMGQLAMMSVSNPAMAKILSGAVTAGDPKDNAMRTLEAAAAPLDAALAAETAAGNPDADLVALMGMSFIKWDAVKADGIASDAEMKDYVSTVNTPWKALGGLAA